MGIQVNGNTNNINAGIGSLSIEDLNELEIIGVATAASFKTGVSNLHNVGLTLSGGQIDVGSNIKIGTAGIVTASNFKTGISNLHDVGLTLTGGQLDVGSNIKIGNAGVVTATSFVGSLSGGSVSGTSGAFTGNLDVNSDTSKLKIGAGDDFQFFHNGSNNFIETNNGDIRIKTSDSSGNLTFTAGGSTESARITSTGQLVVGNNPTVDTNTNLHVEEASGECGVVIEGNTGGAGAYLLLRNNSTSSTPRTYIGGVDASGQGTSQIDFHNLNDSNNEGKLVLSTRPSGGSMQERVIIGSDGKVDVIGGYIGRGVSDSFTLNGVNQPHYGLQLNASSTVPVAFSGYYGIAFASEGLERLRITRNGKIGINNTSPECRTGGIDTSSNDGTSGKTFTDMRGHSSLILRNPSTTQHSFTQILFENGGGTSAATMFRHRLGPSQGSLQNFVGDLCLFRRTGNAGGSNSDYRESTRWCGANEQARQVWWASGDADTSGVTRLGWHHLSAQRDHPGTDAYSFFRLETGAASYSRGGFGKYTVVWTTGHASGYGLQIGHFGYYMHHSNSRIYVNEHIIHRERYSNGSYYGWDDSPGMRIINNTASGGTNAAISFRCGGRRHSGGFDMGVMVGIFIELYAPESANGDTNPRLYVAGNSESNLNGGGFGTPVSHAYCTFQSSNPNHSGQP